MWKHFKCAYSEKRLEKVKHRVAYSLTWRWDGSTPDTKAECRGWGDNYEAPCNQGGPWQAERGLMSRCVNPQLQGSTANQPPRRGLRGTITQALHHHAGRKAITSPFPCAAIPTITPYLQVSNQGAQMTREALVKAKVAGGCNQIVKSVKRKRQKKRKGRKIFGLCKWFIQAI